MSAFKEGVSPDFGLVAPTTWIRAIDQLLLLGEVAPARHALHHLREQEPELDWPGSVLELVDLLPEHAGEPLPFKDDQDKDVQVVERPGASCVVFAFCGRRQRINMPLWLFHRWVSALDDVSVVYLRDFDENHFVGGIRSLGSRAETVAALQGIASQLGARRIVCLGNSSGGYAAMRYGLDIGAERVANFGGSVNLEPGFNTYLNRTGDPVQAFSELLVGQGLDGVLNGQASRMTPDDKVEAIQDGGVQRGQRKRLVRPLDRSEMVQRKSTRRVHEAVPSAGNAQTASSSVPTNTSRNLANPPRRISSGNGPWPAYPVRETRIAPAAPAMCSW